jgi:hypothetical protein
VKRTREEEKRVRKKPAGPAKKKKIKDGTIFFFFPKFSEGDQKNKKSFSSGVGRDKQPNYVCVCVRASPPFFSFHAASVVF